jgi:hypothetical protein
VNATQVLHALKDETARLVAAGEHAAADALKAAVGEFEALTTHDLPAAQARAAEFAAKISRAPAPEPERQPEPEPGAAEQE